MLDAYLDQFPTDLGKYLMHSPTGEVIFGGKTIRF